MSVLNGKWCWQSGWQVKRKTGKKCDSKGFYTKMPQVNFEPFSNKVGVTSVI